jgi:hypothetical protein
MGQPITVVETRSSRPGLVRFELNRPLSGMGHERWTVDAAVEGNRPVDELARRLFAHGGVDGVHINGSVVTVGLGRGATSAGLAAVIEGLFRYYPDAPVSDTTATSAPPAGEAEGHAEVEAEPSDDPASEPAEEPAPTSDG